MSLESQRLLYEKVFQSHAEELKSILCDPIVYEHVDNRFPPTFEELLESFKLREFGAPSHRQEETWIDYIIRHKATQNAIGRVEATVLKNRAEVAYFIGQAYWRQGYGSESLEWLHHFLHQNYGIKEFWATVTPRNIASKGLLLKKGYCQVSNQDLPQLTSYEPGDWVFRFNWL